MWTDDTPVKVLVGGEEGSHLGRFWTYIGDEQHPYSVYDFTMSRSRDGPQQFLQTFRGYLHADAYAGYDAIYLGSDSRIVEVACWAHARRKFFDARHNYPHGVAHMRVEDLCQRQSLIQCFRLRMIISIRMRSPRRWCGRRRYLGRMRNLARGYRNGRGWRVG